MHPNIMQALADNPDTKLRVEPVFPRKFIFRASLVDSGEEIVRGEISTSITGALDKLEKELASA